MIGQRFGHVVVKEAAGSSRQGRLFNCLCDCGNEKIISRGYLRSTDRDGVAASCGCMAGGLSNKTHGLTKSKVFRAWSAMCSRCSNPNVPEWKNYGGRGILVSKEWAASFMAFYRDMGEPPSAESELDRIDNNGNYQKGNCRWTTRKNNLRNRRVSRLITFKGQTLTLSEWAERLGINKTTLHNRLESGWPIDKALAQTVGQSGPKKQTKEE